MTQMPDFNSIKQINPYSIEYWSARDLMPLLGYKKWERFEDTIKKAIDACIISRQNASVHFVTVKRKCIRREGSSTND